LISGDMLQRRGRPGIKKKRGGPRYLRVTRDALTGSGGSEYWGWGNAFLRERGKAVNVRDSS